MIIVRYDMLHTRCVRTCLQESMRLYPAGAEGTSRSVTQDIPLDGGRVVLPAGTIAWIPIFALQRCSRNFDDPSLFKPVSSMASL